VNDARKPRVVSAADRPGTGIEFLQAIVEGEYENLPIGRHLGFRLVEAGKGKVALAGNPDERSYNYIDTVHGGWTAAILDTAMALAALSQLGADQTFTTIDIRINYLRGITLETGEVRAEGRVIHGGRRLAYCEADLRDRAGKLLAHGTGTCLILPRE
jgi:uncharacterized protein (TIGR00369 family)